MTDTQLSTTPRRYRWLSILVGIIFIIVGAWCIFTPFSTVAALTILFIVGFFAAGFFEICAAFATRGSDNWGWRLTAGIINVLLAIWLCAMPVGEASTVLIWVVGFYIFFYSALGIGESCQMFKYGIPNAGWMLVFSILGLVCAFLFLVSPAFGAAYISWLAGLAFITYGIFRFLA